MTIYVLFLKVNISFQAFKLSKHAHHADSCYIFNQGDMTEIMLKRRFILTNANIKPRGCFCDQRLKHNQSIAIGRYLHEEVLHVIVSKMEAFKLCLFVCNIWPTYDSQDIQ